MAELSIKESDIKMLFGTGSQYSIYDIVAVARARIPNPWEPVIFVCDFAPISADELEHFSIFWKGYNDSKAQTALGITKKSYCVVTEKSLDWSASDFGLPAFIQKFKESYNVSNVTTLVAIPLKSDKETVGGYEENMSRLRRYVFDTKIDNVIFPTYAVLQHKLLKNGIDLSVYAENIFERKCRNSLTYNYLDTVIKDIESRIRPDTVLQDIKEMRTFYVKLLSTYLALKYNVPPIYIGSFIDEYLEFEFIYSFKRLSLIERLMFVQRLPGVFGYVSPHNDFRCLAALKSRIWPHPAYVFDISENSIVPESEYVNFQLGVPGLKLVDYRTLFPGSKHFFETDNKSLVQQGADDASIDFKLSALFTAFADAVTEQDIFPTVKNTVMVIRDKKKYILYCPEELGIEAVLMSEVFGSYPLVIPESKFKYLIDAQLVKALLYRERAESVREGVDGLALTWRQFSDKVAMKPAIPFEVTLYSLSMEPQSINLSYYDKLLRCMTDVYPIITSCESELCERSPLFDMLSPKSLRQDSQFSKAVSCFGTLRSLSSKSIIPVTFAAFKGRKELF